MKASFYLRRAKSGKIALIILSVHAGKWRVAVSTGVSIPPDKWEQSKQRAKRGYIHEVSANARLTTILVSAVGIYTDMLNTGTEPTMDVYRTALLAKLRGGIMKQPVAQYPTVWEAFDLHREEHREKTAPGTTQSYRVIRRHLESYNKAHSENLGWDSFSLSFFAAYLRHLISVHKLKNSTIKKDIVILRAFLRWSEEQKGFPVNPDYKRFTRKQLPKGESSQKIYLTPNELTTLWELQLEPRLSKVRDLFLFHCYTALRFADGQALRPEHRKGNDLHLVTGKNRKAIVVPLHPIAAAIWERWEGRLPRIGNQRFNEYLREVCQRAGMNAPEVVVSYSGSKRTERTVERWELVSSHTAKRTAVTNLLLSGKVSLESICAVTGNSLATIQRYIVPTSDDVRRQVVATWGE